MNIPESVVIEKANNEVGLQNKYFHSRKTTTTTITGTPKSVTMYVCVYVCTICAQAGREKVSKILI